MRIVGGALNGRKLNTFKGDAIRPTADNVRESLFNILGKKVEGSDFLDLFCGTGAVGIEAVSRGAKKVVFNDISKESVSLTRKNLSSLGIAAAVSQSDGIIFLDTASEKFDIVYIDPPYKSEFKISALNAAADKLKAGGIAVLEDETPFTGVVNGLVLTDVRKYGRVFLNFFEKAEKGAVVYAGTFDPVTKGHFISVMSALKVFGKVLVVLGVNPAKEPFFTREERKDFLTETFKDVKGVEIVDFADFESSGKYAEYLAENGVLYYVRGVRNAEDFAYEKKYERKNKTLYQGIKTAYIFCGSDENGISASKVRKNMRCGKDYESFLPEGSAKKIADAFKGKKRI